MKIIAPIQELLQYLNVLQKGIPGKTTMEIVNGILLEVIGNSLVVNTNNLEMSIKAVIEDVEIIDGGAVVLPAKFIDILKQLPENKVEINREADELKVEIKSGKANFSLYGMDAEEFPRFSPRESWSSWNNINLPAGDLKKILQRVNFAVSQEETKPLFKAVCIEIDESGNINFTATDTYRLAYYKKSFSNSQMEPGTLLVPGKTLQELSKALENSEEEVECFFEQKEMLFAYKDFEFSTRLLDDKYPDFNSIFPASYNTKIKVNRSVFDKLLHRASLVAQGINNMINLEVRDKALKVSAGSDIGKMEEEIPLEEKEGEDLEGILLNARFLIEPLRILDEDILEIGFNGPLSPCIFNVDNEAEQYRYLVLPIKSGS